MTPGRGSSGGGRSPHLALVTTGGPTWKPLPVIFTTLFAPFGAAAPDLWLIVARAGGIMAVGLGAVAAVRLARSDAPGRAPAVIAGALALAGLLTLYQYVSSVLQGESEGLLAALVLLAILRFFDGAPRQALLLGFAAALVRPETWPFLALYGAWLWRRDPDSRALTLALFALIGALWFLPELWGSGSLLRGVRWAQNPRQGSPALSSCPSCSEITGTAWPLLTTPFKAGVVLALGRAGSAPAVDRATGGGGVCGVAGARVDRRGGGTDADRLLGQRSLPDRARRSARGRRSRRMGVDVGVLAAAPDAARRRPPSRC